jgi:putative DNA methylase
MPVRKKLIEVALPLDAINSEGAHRKRKAPSGYPTTLHKWWAQRPVAAARAVIFAQMVDDPSSWPDLFPTEKAQEKERQRLFRIIEDLVLWENTTDETVLQKAREEIWQSWRRACAENADHPRGKELFDRHKLPVFHDPFAGSGAIPLEAQRLGLDSHASDLNPVAVLINKAMIEIPPRFAGKSPVNPAWRGKNADEQAMTTQWRGAQGLAEDVRYYGQWMRDEAEKRIGHLYPKVAVTPEMAKERPDLEPYVGQQLTVIAWLWARTVKSPNPAFATVDVPLASTFMLSTKAGKETYVEPVIEGGSYRFTVKVGKPKDAEKAKSGTKASRANFNCLMSSAPISGDYIKAEGNAGRMGARLMAIVAEGTRGRVYLAPLAEHEGAALKAKPEWKPEGEIAKRMTGGNCTPYGLTTWGDLFTPRQLVALTTFSDLVQEVRERVRLDALIGCLPDDAKLLCDGGTGAAAYADGVCTFLAMAISRVADYGSSIATWRPKDSAMRSTMPKQAIQMAWDFAEGSVFGGSSSGFRECTNVVAKVIESALTGHARGTAQQGNVRHEWGTGAQSAIVSTDPPYYDNIGYADLSDFFYVWLRRSLRPVFPDLFATLAVPKAEELVATPYRHGSKENAEKFFLDGMTQAMHRLAEQAHPAFPVTIYYAFKQAESDDDSGTASTGWDTFLAAVIEAGFAISGTWPMRTEGDNRSVGIGTNALASSIILVCRPRPASAPTATRREFVAALKAELPTALRYLQGGNIAPVDLAQAAIGPGMAVYTRYSKVVDAQGNPVSVREALTLINQVLDETLAEQEGDFDTDSRFALAWFEQHGFDEGEFGVANVLAQAKNTGMNGLVESGILASSRGRVRLLRADELPEDWDPDTDPRLTAWEVVHQLIRVLGSGGEPAAAELLVKLGTRAEPARELCYRLYTLCERKKRAADALSYNALVQSWPEMLRLAADLGRSSGGRSAGPDGDLFDQ